MTLRQRLLKLVYPLFMRLQRANKKNEAAFPTPQAPKVPFYSLSATGNDGKPFDFSHLKGKKVLIVNTASNCGYTNQYADLQKLWEMKKENLVIIGFPANDFKEQEKGSDEEIAQFCKVNFGVSFPLMKKSVVIEDKDQSPVYQWLTDPARNGWNEKAPSWNFSKYLVDEKGWLTRYFGPAVSPLSEEIINALK